MKEFESCLSGVIPPCLTGGWSNQCIVLGTEISAVFLKRVGRKAFSSGGMEGSGGETSGTRPRESPGSGALAIGEQIHAVAFTVYRASMNSRRAVRYGISHEKGRVSRKFKAGRLN